MTVTFIAGNSVLDPSASGLTSVVLLTSSWAMVSTSAAFGVSASYPAGDKITAVTVVYGSISFSGMLSFSSCEVGISVVEGVNT